MNLILWMTSWFSARGKAISLYRRGMAKAKLRDYPAAVDFYSQTIALTATPADVRGMALYNRALVYSALGDGAKATDDLNQVLAVAETPANIKTEAKRKLARMRRHAGDAPAHA
ncbi:hypothetical protein M4951_08355 [Blastopirellula sp. J2-11]|uniref:hypothetical protein n=1 Tax=Blastopirellula sp. J2-11 TaxID=2943192 RepID=UPI0021CA7FC8|nr:hypothetical protein [Blastopirellula sp. J2-11]UUO08313.1 hypothetical protein M4951_08355 [Blastopirellula sp. J2-11]